MPRKKIEFNKSMASDKRAEEFCYLRENILNSKTEGLYPSRNFVEDMPDAGFDEGEYVIRSIDRFVFTYVPSDNRSPVYHDVGSTLLTSDFSFGGTKVADACQGRGEVRALFDDGEVERFSHDTLNVTHSEVFDFNTLSVAVTSKDKILYDGLHYFYFVGKKIYRQLDAETPVLVFNDTGLTPISVSAFGDRIILFFDNGDNYIDVAFWDKSDPDLYDKRITVSNALFLGGGNIDGTLMLIKSVGNETNSKEGKGEIEVTAYDGENFVYLNSIKAGDSDIKFIDCSVGNGIMVFAVDSNTGSNDYLNKNWVYKVWNSGRIEALYQPTGTSQNEVTSVNVQFEHISIGTKEDTVGTFLRNKGKHSGFNLYKDYSTSNYITNFMNEVANRHTLNSVGLTFEKLFNNGDDEEEVEVYYRTSEREDFTLLGTVTAKVVSDNVDSRIPQEVKDANYLDDTKGLPQQVIIITKMPDGTALPEYNEIQYMFKLKNGFSIIRSWYDYDYITRNSV